MVSSAGGFRVESCGKTVPIPQKISVDDPTEALEHKERM